MAQNGNTTLHHARHFKDGKFINYLSLRDEGDLMRDVEKFYEYYHFERDVDVNELSLIQLKRGAELAARPEIHQYGSGSRRNYEQDGTPLSDVAVDTHGTKAVESGPTILLSVQRPVVTSERRLNRSNVEQSPPRTSLYLPQHKMIPSEIEAQALDAELQPTLKSLTKETVLILATCVVGAFAQGCAQEALVGANLKWPVTLGIAVFDDQSKLRFLDPQKGASKFAIVNAIPWFAACAGAVVIDPLTFQYGRRRALLVAGIFCWAAPIGAAYSQTWIQLLVCRLLTGISIGAKSSIIPIMISEVAPHRMREKLLVLWQMFVSAGIAVTALTNCLFHDYWRLQVGITFVSAVPLIFGCLLISESPHWLIKNGEYTKAFSVLKRLRPTTLQAARDIYQIYAHVKIEPYTLNEEQINLNDVFKSPKCPKRKFLSRFPQLFSVHRNRTAVFGASSVMAAQQLCGINMFAFLAASIFSAVGNSQMVGLWFNVGFASTNFLFSALAYFLITTFGRRALILSSLTLMMPFLFIAGRLSGNIGSGSPGGIAALVIVYTAICSYGASVIPFMYSSEVFSITYRELGMSFACFVNFALAGVLALLVSKYIYISSHIDGVPIHKTSNAPTIFYIFGGLIAVAICSVWSFMRAPEEPKSLEDMGVLFEAPTFLYIRWQFATFFQWRDTESYSKWLEGRNRRRDQGTGYEARND